jgi:hypothetical protein
VFDQLWLQIQRRFGGEAALQAVYSPQQADESAQNLFANTRASPFYGRQEFLEGVQERLLAFSAAGGLTETRPILLVCFLLPSLANSASVDWTVRLRQDEHCRQTQR